MRGLCSRRSAIWLFAIVVVLSAAAPGYHFTRPRVRCGIPARDYQFATFSPHLFAMSHSHLSSSLPVDGKPDQEVGRLYQFDVVKLRLDHCSVSEMAVELLPDGHWQMHLRADQNPRQLDPLDVVPNVTTAQPADLYTADLRRNLFYVRVQCYASGTEAKGSPIGKPLVATLTPSPFWVQRGEPQLWIADGCDELVKRFFPLIDRVGIEFYYREAPERQAMRP